MKKNYLFIAAGFLTISSFAQPTLTGLQLNPVIGETMVVDLGEYADHGSIGNNQTWNFSGLEVFGQTIATMIPSSSEFPGTNMGFDLGGGTILYSQIDATQQSYKYQNTPWQSFSFSDPQRFISLPLSSSTNNADAFSGTMIENNVVVGTRVGSTTLVYKGFGTVITPHGSFTNSLKMQLTQSTTDTYISDGHTDNIELMNYYWFVAGIHNPVMGLFSSSFNGETPLQYSQIFVSSTLSTSQNILENSVFYPNPTSDELNVISPNTTEDLTVSVIDLNGQVVFEETIDSFNNVFTISVSNLNPGIYFAEIKLVDGSIARKKFQKI